jgi:hypothetical protein
MNPVHCFSLFSRSFTTISGQMGLVVSGVSVSANLTLIMFFLVFVPVRGRFQLFLVSWICDTVLDNPTHLLHPLQELLRFVSVAQLILTRYDSSFRMRKRDTKCP